jgi:ATP-binding cassette subfamily C exporter for protease/lipase
MTLGGIGGSQPRGPVRHAVHLHGHGTAVSRDHRHREAVPTHVSERHKPELDRSELGRQLGYLPQDVELFEGSIAENIARFGEIDADRVIEAAQRAGMHEMILRFPQGYDTPIGAGGSVLSGGQRQRIALARALYGDPRVLVLDEPNANLDDAGEAALVAALLDLKARGCTVFLVTHRPSALQVVDRLMVMRDGAVIADGPRDAVLASLRPAAAAAPAPDPTPPADDAAGPA